MLQSHFPFCFFPGGRVPMPIPAGANVLDWLRDIEKRALLSKCDTIADRLKLCCPSGSDLTQVTTATHYRLCGVGRLHNVLTPIITNPSFPIPPQSGATAAADDWINCVCVVMTKNAGLTLTIFRSCIFSAPDVS